MSLRRLGWLTRAVSTATPVPLKRISGTITNANCESPRLRCSFWFSVSAPASGRPRSVRRRLDLPPERENDQMTAIAHQIAPDRGTVHADLGDRAARLEAENRTLRQALLNAQARAGEIEPPDAIETTRDAQVWLAWARANHHQAGCLCHRCPEARVLRR